MGAGCSSAAPVGPGAQVKSDAPITLVRRPGHIFLSYHPADTGDQQTEGGDGAAGRVRDWLVSRGYVVKLSEPDPDAAAAPGGSGTRSVRRLAGVQSGLEITWQQRMQQSVEACEAFVALCSEHYGSAPEARRELAAAEALPAPPPHSPSASAPDPDPGAATAAAAAAGPAAWEPPPGPALLPLWHSGAWPPAAAAAATSLGSLQRVPRGPRPLCRTVLEAAMGELLDRLQQAGCMPVPAKPAPGTAAAAAPRSAAAAGLAGFGAAGAAQLAPAPPMDECFLPGPGDPPDEAYAVVRCYMGTLQELVDRLALTVRPTVFDLDGKTYSGDLPPDPSAPPPAGPFSPTSFPFAPGPYSSPSAAATAGTTATGYSSAPPSYLTGTMGSPGGFRPPTAPRPGTAAVLQPGLLLVSRPHVTLRNGTIRLRRNQRLRVTGHGCVLDSVMVMTEAAGSSKLSAVGGSGAGAGGGGGGGVVAAGEAGFGGAYAADRGMVELSDGAVGIRMLSCKLVNNAPTAALLITDGATAALRDCDVESRCGPGARVAGAGSVLLASGCCLQHCAGACLALEAGGAAQLSASTVLDSERHNGVAAGSGARLRADRCLVSGGQAGVNLFAGASAELVGCEVAGNVLAGAEVREPGSRLLASDTKFARNGQSGLLVADGGLADLMGCTLSGNTTHGLVLRGEGSQGTLRQVTLSYNGQAGALLTDRAAAGLTSCEAAGNKMSGLVVWGPGSAASASDCRLLQNAGAGLAVRDGARAELRRVTAKLNRAGGAEVAGPGSVLAADRGCVIDPKPATVAGGAVAVLPEEGEGKGGGGGSGGKGNGGGK